MTKEEFLELDKETMLFKVGRLVKEKKLTSKQGFEYAKAWAIENNNRTTQLLESIKEVGL